MNIQGNINTIKTLPVSRTCLTTLRFKLFIDFTERKENVPFIICGYWKWATRARILSQTLTHGNNKNEIR